MEQNRNHRNKPGIYVQKNFKRSEKPNEEKIIFSTNGAGKTAYPHAIKLTWTLSLHHIQKLTQKGTKGPPWWRSG